MGLQCLEANSWCFRLVRWPLGKAIQEGRGTFQQLLHTMGLLKQEFLKLRGQLATTAKKAQDNPHEPRFRFQRGKTLYDLGYPELAAGDYEKTLMLIKYGLDFSSDLGEDVRVLGLQVAVKKKVSKFFIVIDFKLDLLIE